MTEGEGFAVPQGIQERRGKRRGRKSIRGWVRDDYLSVYPAGEFSPEDGGILCLCCSVWWPLEHEPRATVESLLATCTGPARPPSPLLEMIWNVPKGLGSGLSWMGQEPWAIFLLAMGWVFYKLCQHLHFL